MIKRKNVAKTPYTRNLLPHNRKELFFDVVKLHYLPLICLGLFMFLFYLPALLNELATDIYFARQSENIAADITETQRQLVYETLASGRMTSALIMIPAFGVFGLGVAGLVRVIRQYAWGEIVFPFRDFMLGMRQNGKQLVLLAMLAGSVRALCIYLDALTVFNAQTALSYASSAMWGTAYLFLLPVAAYMTVCIPIYGNTFWQNAVQSMVLYRKTLWKTLLALGCCGGVFLLKMIPNVALRFWMSIVGSIGCPFLFLGWFLFAYHQLDRYINMEKHPQIVGKGLWAENAES